MAIFDADKKVEKVKKEREGIYQSSQHPEHFENEGGEYANVPEQDINEMEAEKNRDLKKKENKKDKGKENDQVSLAENPEASSESGIPGTDQKDNIGTAGSGAGLGNNQGGGTAKFPNKG